MPIHSARLLSQYTDRFQAKSFEATYVKPHAALATRLSHFEIAHWHRNILGVSPLRPNDHDTKWQGLRELKDIRMVEIAGRGNGPCMEGGH